MRIATAPLDVSRRLGVAPDALVVHRTTYQLLDNEPWSRKSSYFDHDLAKRAGVDTPHDLPQGFVRKLHEAGFAEMAWTDEITDETASPEDAAELSVAIGSPLLVQTRTGRAPLPRRIASHASHGLCGSGGRSKLIYEIGDAKALDAVQ